jgi:tetratricopeptide (TPR) repeat protein
MRYLALILLYACAGVAKPPTVPADPPGGASPVSDLTSAHPPVIDPARASGSLRARDPRVVDLDIIRITARAIRPGGDVELTSVASADLFKQANVAAKGGQHKAAIATYRQLVSDFPGSQFAPVSLFNIAAIHDAQGDLGSTVATLTELVESYADTRESVEGHLYIAALQADHQQWPEAAATVAAIVARPRLTYADRVEAYARLGYVELEQHRYDEADAALSQAIEAWRSAPRIDDAYYVAMAHYYRGELMHRRFLEAPVRRGDDAMIADLDTKRALAVQAYDRWRESLCFKHAYWATASGYQMSQIFVEVWEAHVAAPYPARIAAAARPTYVAEVHRRVRVDLVKALEGHRMNVELAKAYGVDTAWSKASEQQAVAIMELLANDGAGRYVLPAA